MKIIHFLVGILIIFLCSCTKEKSTLPVMFIRNGQNILAHKNTLSDFTFINNCDTIHLKGNVKYRGGHSLGYEKKSYGVEFTEKVSLAGLPSEDDWVLNAGYIDKTLMRHKLGYDLFMKMSRSNRAPRTAYIEVYEKEDYRGIFILTQKLTAKVLGIKKDGLLFKEPPLFYIGDMKYQDEKNLFQQQFPKIKQEDKKDILLKFRTFLFYADEQEFYHKINDWIDVNNVIDWHLLLLLANAGDNINKNFYLYKTDSLSPFRVTLWDFDHSFGRDGDGELNLMERPLNLHKSILFTRLRNNPFLDFNHLIAERWNTLRSEDIISYRSIKRLISEMNLNLYPAIHRNEARWPGDSPDYFDSNSYYQEVQLMRSFIKNRITEMDRIFCYSEN